MDDTQLASETWSVVATVRASHSLCDLFACHYLALGARQVFLFHDDPEMAFPVQKDGVQNTVCDERWWQSGRPEALEKRQVYNATQAKNECSTDWILHCDVDELIWSEQAVSEVLGALPGIVGGVRVRTAEAVYDSVPACDRMFATPYFKIFYRKGRGKAYGDISQRAYGGIWEASKYGFWGHPIGKSFIRVRAPVGRMPLHAKRRSEIAGFRMHEVSEQMILRHYDTLSPELWKEKHLRRINGDVATPLAGKFRQRQQKLIVEAALAGETALEQLYLKMATLPPDVLAECIASGFVRVIPPEPHLLKHAPPAA